MTTSKRRGERDGDLTGDDAEVWSHVAGSVKRVRLKDRVSHVEVKAEAAPRPRETSTKKETTASRVKSHAPAAVAALPPKPPKVPPLAPVESKTARRIGRGQIAIDARIDLHGHTQAEAHHMLVAFIRRCHARGARTVLVITGKGKPDGDAPSSGGGLFARSRGVLRQVVPMWLAAAELRPHVVGFTTAHARHGGNGALYVQVRRKER